MPWRVSSRRSGFSAIAPERDESGKPIAYAFQAWQSVRAKIMSDGFADAICTFVPPDIQPKHGDVEILEGGKVA